MTRSWAFAVGSVRAKESALLTRQELDGLLQCADERELAARLRERGYGDPAAPADDVDGLLRQEKAQLWAYLQEVAPDGSLFVPFLYRNDIHNAKVALKLTLAGRKEGPYLPDGTIPAARLREAAEERRFDALPAWLCGAMEEAYDLLAHARDAGLADAVIDRAGMAAMREAAEKDDTLRPLFDELVFYNNVKIVLRALRTGKGSLFLERALCPVPGMETDDWIQAAREGEEAFLTRLRETDAYGAREAADAWSESPAALERFAADRQMVLARRAGAQTLGPAPVAAYLLAKEAELRALHMAASGLRTGETPARMRERGPQLYG